MSIMYELDSIKEKDREIIHRFRKSVYFSVNTSVK